MKIVNYVKSLMLVMFALAAANMTAANVDANAALGKAVQFLNTQSGTKFMASPSTLGARYPS